MRKDALGLNLPIFMSASSLLVLSYLYRVRCFPFFHGLDGLWWLLLILELFVLVESTEIVLLGFDTILRIEFED